jgi:hypothetical protein
LHLRNELLPAASKAPEALLCKPQLRSKTKQALFRVFRLGIEAFLQQIISYAISLLLFI